MHRQPKAAPALRRRPQTQRGINKGESDITQQNNCKFKMVSLISYHQPAAEARKGKMFKDFHSGFWCLFIIKVRRRISLPLIQLFWFLDRFMVAVSKDLFWEAMFHKKVPSSILYICGLKERLVSTTPNYCMVSNNEALRLLLVQGDQKSCLGSE